MSTELAHAIRLAQEGNQQAFSLIYKEFVARVYALCLRLLGDRQRAEDAAQEVFTKIWLQLPGFRGDSSFATWLHSIATRTAIDIWRKDKVMRLVVSDEIVESVAAAQVAEARDLEQAIQKLPAQAKAVFVLFAIEGLGHQEIADMLDIAEGSSKAQYHRARQLLQGYLNDY